MGGAFGEYGFAVRTYECGPDGRATLPTVCNYLQEAASLNAESLGFSKSNFSAVGENISWVLTRLRVEMVRYPRWEERVTVGTWPRGARRIVAWRDFEVRGADGGLIGSASSEWMLIDLASRKMVPVPPAVFDAANTGRAPALGPAPFGRLRWDCAQVAADAIRLRARRGDIDLNGHVNNVRYVEWLLEGVPAGAGVCREFEIVYRSETIAGDEVVAETVETAPGRFDHRLSSPAGADHVLARTVWSAG